MKRNIKFYRVRKDFITPKERLVFKRKKSLLTKISESFTALLFLFCVSLGGMYV